MFINEGYWLFCNMKWICWMWGHIECVDCIVTNKAEKISWLMIVKYLLYYKIFCYLRSYHFFNGFSKTGECKSWKRNQVIDNCSITSCTCLTIQFCRLCALKDLQWGYKVQIKNCKCWMITIHILLNIYWKRRITVGCLVNKVL